MQSRQKSREADNSIPHFYVETSFVFRRLFNIHPPATMYKACPTRDVSQYLWYIGIELPDATHFLPPLEAIKKKEMNAVDELNLLLGIGPPKPVLPVTLQKSGYTPVRTLGKGSFGQALLIFNKEKNSYFVAKHINMNSMTAKTRKEAHNEIQMLQQLSHPNIVKYVEFFEEHPHLYIIMEYADAGDLFMHMKQYRESTGDGCLPELQIINLFVQITMAVRYMHERKLLHRDIKSQNIFLTKSHVVKLGDFGISTVLQNTMAMAKTMCGTPCYFSPELCSGRPYNNKSDIWALGVLLYEMAGGKLPFESASMKRLMDEIMTKDPPRIPRQYSDGLWQLIQSMLHKDPLCRPDAGSVLHSPVLLQAIPSISSKLSVSVTHHQRLPEAAGRIEEDRRQLPEVDRVSSDPTRDDCLVEDSPMASVVRNLNTLSKDSEQFNSVRQQLANCEVLDVPTEQFDDGFGTTLDLEKLNMEEDFSPLASTGHPEQIITGACRCSSLSYRAPLSRVFGSFSCSCECCRRFSGAAVVEWLHLPSALYSEVSLLCSTLGCYTKDDSVMYFCRECGSSIAMEHGGIEGCILAKASLDFKATEILRTFQHVVPR